MATYVPNAAEVILLNHLFKITAPALTLRLFKNDYTPDSETVVSSLTEADFTGYSAATLTRGNWNSATSVNGEAVIQYSSAIQFDATSSQTIYGFYLTENDGDALVYVERFSASRSLDNGSTLSITPKISLSNKEA